MNPRSTDYKADALTTMPLRHVASFGWLSIIACDRGRQFTSNLWHLLCELGLGCKLSHTCAYHPTANDICERFNKQLKTFLKTHANNDWTSHLLWVLLGIRSSFLEYLVCSSAQLFLGSRVRLPGQYFEFHKYQFDLHFDYFQRLNRFFHSVCAIPPWIVTSNAFFIDMPLHNAGYVFVEKDASRSPLERTYFGLFKVIYKADRHFTLLQNGALHNVSINCLITARFPIFCTDEFLQSSTCEAAESTENVHLSSDDSSSSKSSQLPDVDFVFRCSRVWRVIRPLAILDL